MGFLQKLFGPNVEEMEAKGELKGLIQALSYESGKDSWKVRRDAARALGRIGDARAVEPLITAFAVEESVRRHVARALCRIGDVRAVEPLIAALRDDEFGKRTDAAWALGKLGDTRAVEPLIATLGDEHRFARKDAVRALGMLGDTRAVEPLIAALEDESWLVRNAAVQALGEIGDARAVEPLVVALEDDEKRVSESAAKALDMIGAPAKMPAKVPAMLELEKLRDRIAALPRRHPYQGPVFRSIAEQGKQQITIISRSIDRAVKALKTGKDAGGNSITPELVGKGLQRLVADTRKSGFEALMQVLDHFGIEELKGHLVELDQIAEGLK